MQSGVTKVKLLWITLFCVAIGFLESAVVVYLRELYYPSGFRFPLSTMNDNIALTEVIRELATLLILLSFANVAGQSRKQRIAWFFYCFAVWDIFYYVFLKALIDWPESFFTWDILFLIPTTWTGPVIAPVIVSISMILLASLLLWIDARLPAFKVQWKTSVLLLIGASLVFLSFIWDYSRFMIEHCTFRGLFQPDIVQKAIQSYIPVQFSWWLFIPGELLILAGLFKIFSRASETYKRI